MYNFIYTYMQVVYQTVFLWRSFMQGRSRMQHSWYQCEATIHESMHLKSSVATQRPVRGRELMWFQLSSSTRKFLNSQQSAHKTNNICHVIILAKSKTKWNKQYSHIYICMKYILLYTEIKIFHLKKFIFIKIIVQDNIEKVFSLVILILFILLIL